MTTVKKGKDKEDSRDANMKPKQVQIVGTSIKLYHIITSHCGVHYQVNNDGFITITTTKKILGDILFWATEAAGWRPASVNLGWAASRATVTDNCLTVAVTVSKPPRLILR